MSLRYRACFTALWGVIIGVVLLVGFFVVPPISVLADEPPAHTKTLTPNGDGSYTLTLSVRGRSQMSTEKTRANVIVVFDKSNSMNNKHKKETRLKVAKEAVNALADELMQNNTIDDPSRIQMSLVTFESIAYKERFGGSLWTSDLNAFQQAVDDIETPHDAGLPKYHGGTNWEDALKAANEVAQSSDGDPTYVIFVSDGNPTFYNGTKHNYTKTASGHYLLGTGHDEGKEGKKNVQECFGPAIDDARNVVTSGNTFYAIGTFGDVDRMRDLVDYAYDGQQTDNYYFDAKDQEGIVNAFNSIVADITHESYYRDVKIKDTLTDMVSATNIDGQVTTFKYTKTSANGITTDWSEAPKAKLSGDTVTWDLSSISQLENNVIYSVSFTVTPTQKALDSVAAAANGNGLDENVLDNGDGTYSVYSNTSATLEYIRQKTVNGVVTDQEHGTSPYERPTMKVPLSQVKVEKKWSGDDISDHASKTITVQLKRTMTINGVETTKDYGDPITLDAGNDWSKDIVVPGGLEGDTTWSVDEISPIEGYDTSYSSPVIYSSYRSGNINGSTDGVNTITNTLKTYDIIMYKTSSTDGNAKTPLAGAEFTVFAEDGETIVAPAIATDNDGKAKFSDLKPGTYIIRETKVPAGYQKLDNDLRLVIDTSGNATLNGLPISSDHQGENGNSGYWFQIDVDNRVLGALPYAGGVGNIPFVGAGIMFIVFAVGFVLYCIYRKSFVSVAH